MRILLIVIFTALIYNANAQTKLLPGAGIVEKKWMKDQSSIMTWLIVKDTTLIPIGKVYTRITQNDKYTTITTSVHLQATTASWFDTTIAETETLKPIYHSSFNSQRNLVLNFGKIVTGYYIDKTTQKQYAVSDTTDGNYFDSNLYPAMILWLPLKEGYQTQIPVYDYKPSGKQGVVRAFIREVKTAKLQTQLCGVQDVWMVTVTDDISNNETTTIYYIGKSDRKLWKQEIIAGNRKMIMLAV
jgi:hypothetical protein